MKVAKWGNSLAVRLPKEMVEALGLSEGDELEFEMTTEGWMEASKALTTREWLEMLRGKFEGRLPAGFKFKRSEAVRPGYE
ncbi:AbrB/MazE/SpoVT family DNA-binding domain-containing protein [Phenylobacterium sp.]|uniref:AbrB/MazE/SpoVT family DNA-binding domain-containing protein n=1 Tax=Phenylobacterium sp. TaxID=1871053 RepID=UPI0025CCA539|nr:AbrB/MazE/SpoVT family DNA-binding domain-containing protein [Phenylobacterium sp.]MBX3483320.1 AbrB/MazE/SpoVT family DNA-binding domain-containing protein [Phenylobacterium sp.]